MFWFLFRYDALIVHPLASAASMTSSDTLRNCEPGIVNVAVVARAGKAFIIFAVASDVIMCSVMEPPARNGIPSKSINLDE